MSQAKKKVTHLPVLLGTFAYRLLFILQQHYEYFRRTNWHCAAGEDEGKRKEGNERQRQSGLLRNKGNVVER